MNLLIEHHGPVAAIKLQSGKSNALAEGLVQDLHAAFKTLKQDAACRGIILTSALPKFFSPGFNLFEVTQYDKKRLRGFLRDFINLYHFMFTLPKPTVAALNGHTVAGGFCISLACDFRLMADGPFVIGLNELKLGVVIPFGIVQMLQAVVGPGAAREIAYFGKNYSPHEALELGVVDQVVAPDQLMTVALEQANSLAEKSPEAFATMKRYLKRDLADFMMAHDLREADTFVDIWFSAETQQRLRDAVQQMKQKP